MELRDLTRRRKKLLGNLRGEKNRIQNVLETANVKIGNIISDMFGVSGQEMLKALLSGPVPEVDPQSWPEESGYRRLPQLAAHDSCHAPRSTVLQGTRSCRGREVPDAIV